MSTREGQNPDDPQADDDLAAERRATVERIRERFLATTGLYPDLTATEVEVAAMVFGDLNAILDEEAARNEG